MNRTTGLGIVKKSLTTLLLFGCLVGISGAANEDKPSENKASEAQALVNDYPTQARVEYVFGCMQQHGGENYDSMYGCVCAIDKIAARIPYANFVATTTLNVMMQTPGEKGGPFRDVKGGREAVREFKNFMKTSEADCGLKVRKRPGTEAPKS